MSGSRDRGAAGPRPLRSGRGTALMRRAAGLRNGVRPATVAGLSLLAALQGCGRADGGDSLPDDSVYVQVMARLAYIRERAEGSGSPDTLRWADSARSAVLRAFGVDAAALERYAARHGDDPRHMGTIWDGVREALEEIEARAERTEGPVDLGPAPPDPRPLDGSADADAVGPPGGDPGGAPEADPGDAGGRER